MNFSENTIVKGLTYHFYQKHKLNIILNNRLRDFAADFYTSLYYDFFILFASSLGYVAKLAIMASFSYSVYMHNCFGRMFLMSLIM